jgi:HSPB1-associated protein 1
MEKIEYVSSLPARALLDNYVRQSKPVVLQETGRRWTAARKWTPAYLFERYGDVRVHVRGSRFGMKDIGDMPLSAYLDWLLNGRHDGGGNQVDPLLAPYPASHRVKPYVAYDARLMQTDLASDLDFASLLPEGYTFRTTRCWIGPEGAATPLHSDSWGFNLFYQVYGRKRFLLFDPSQSKLLYPGDLFEFNTVYSRVNTLNPDHRMFPAFQRAQPVLLTLEPGDILVLPRCWWHDVETLETSISVNCWVVRGRDKLTSSYLVNRVKKTLHGWNLYARGRCTCHLSPSGKDAGELLGWY